MSTGSRLCARVKYTFTGSPAKQAICHCSHCHKISGSAYTTCLILPSPAFTNTSGASSIKEYSFFHESGMKITLHFCGSCGSCVYKEGDDELNRGMVIVQAGTLDGTDGLDGGAEGGMGFGDVEPKAELWVGQRAGWLRAWMGLRS